MEKDYFRIVLVGNGFDKALGLKTNYSEFIFDYLKKAIKETFSKRSYSSELISFELFSYYGAINDSDSMLKDIKTVDEILQFIKNYMNCKFKHDFFKEIIDSFKESRWVDLEQFYYENLNNYFRLFKSSTNYKEIAELNNCMDLLSIELNKYILEQQNLFKINQSNDGMTFFIEKFSESIREERSKQIHRHNRKNPPSKVIFLNFNYTNTLFQFINNSFHNPNMIHISIHGRVNDPNNPIIFGYGDDTREEYQELESAGENELLRKIKSFQYPRTNNYHNLLNYLEFNDFDVFIVGHSCGLSDRTMLKTIFEHRNCIGIQNYHYLGEKEDFEKRIEISRHFNDKIKMRERIFSFDDLAKIPQFN